MASISNIAILLITSGVICQLALSQTIHDGNKLTRMRLQSDLMSVDQQSPMAFNQRPTQFIASTQMHQATAHTRGALVLPANNQLQAGIFHPTTAPAFARNYAHQQPQQDSTGAISNQPAGEDLAKHEQPLQSRSSNSTSTWNSNDNPRTEQANNNGLLRGISEGDLELALRQANSDENVFQPSVAIPTTGHSYDHWSFAYSSTPTYNDQQQTGKDKQQQVTTSTTDQSNSIVPVQYPDPSSGHSFPDDSNRHQETLQRTLASLNSTLSNQPIELSNQVFYDGPATAPPAGDYYFSSAERAPNNERASSNIWW